MNAKNRIAVGVMAGFTGVLSSVTYAEWDNSDAIAYPAPSWPFVQSARADAWVDLGDHYWQCTVGGIEQYDLLVRIEYLWGELQGAFQPTRVQDDCGNLGHRIEHTTDWIAGPTGGCASVFVTTYLDEYYDVLSGTWGDPQNCWEMQAV